MDETEIKPAFDQIKNVEIEEEMKFSYLRYAMSVIVSRALPDVRDGLKPSQRRILVAMNDLNLGPRAKPRKCAKIVGDTNGNYHPHGDAAVYQTLVRLAQNFNIRYPLVNGQGNFGSVDGDPPAAMRYTEARMTDLTPELLSDIDFDTVDYIPNYDETRTEPVILPGKFPNLICNGCAGIAVGVATNIAPHNLNEICDAIDYLLDHPDCEVKDLLTFVQGPDFPSGGIIHGRSGIIDSLTKGRGRVVVRSRYHFEEMKSGKVRIVFTEIPYQVNKTTAIEKIVDCVKEGRIKGISDVADESDKEGMRLIVEVKKGEDEHTVLNQLFKYTQLQDSFNTNSIALVGGRPVRVNLKSMLEAYRDHRMEVIRRKTQFLLNKALARAHILEGLRIAIDNIDAIIDLIRKAPDRKTASLQLQERFGLSDKQADAILEMQLGRLTGLERDKIESEYRDLLVKINEYKEILANERLVIDIIRKDLEELRKKHGNPRRTEIADAIDDFSAEDLIKDEEVAILISHRGYAKRLAITEFRTQGRGGVGVTGMSTHDNDVTEHLIISRTKNMLLFFTDKGKVYWLKSYQIPEMGRASRGRALVNILHMSQQENILSVLSIQDFDERQVVMATANGVVKKTSLTAYSNPKKTGIKAIVLDDNDSLIDVKLTTGDEEIILTSKSGMSIRFHEEECRSMGRVSRGVRGMKLKKGDTVVSMNIVNSEGEILTICENGYGKKSSFEDFRQTHRGGKGVKTIANIKRNGPVIRSMTVYDGDEIMILTNEGKVLRISTAQLRTLGRATSGVRMIRLREEDVIREVVPLAIKEEVEEIESSEPEQLSEEEQAEDEKLSTEEDGDNDYDENDNDDDNDDVDEDGDSEEEEDEDEDEEE